MKHIIIRNLVTQLVIIDKGMQIFPEPLPKGVKEHLKQAVIAFGSNALEEIHSTINTMKGVASIISLLDILMEIGNEESIPILIDIHKNYAGHMEGLTIVHALRNIASEEGYLYLSEIVTKYSNGDFRIVNSRDEIYFSCIALGEWQDIRALEPLKTALKVEYIHRMPRGAIETLAKYEEGRVYLENVKDSMPEHLGLINSILGDTDN